MSKHYDSSKMSSFCNNCTLFRSTTVESNLINTSNMFVSHSARVKFYCLNDVIGCEREVKQHHGALSGSSHYLSTSGNGYSRFVFRKGE